tara:strand:- start:33 stop:332 length:300 start_codon:yes stop_codon:yes gene_type:complete
MSLPKNKKKKTSTKKKKKGIEVAIPSFKRGSNDSRNAFMIDKLMEEQPNLTEEEAKELFYLKIRFGESHGDTKKLRKGGVVKKNYVNPVKIVNNLKKKK